MNKTDSLVEQLRSLGLSRDEATLYVELLRGPGTHLKLAHATGINRTKVYRLVGDLEKRSLITKRTDDRGTFLVAADPATLEVELTTKEQVLGKQRTAFEALLPVLSSIKKGDSNNFVVHTYEGREGFKQMLWHELKAKGECLIFGYGALEKLVDDHAWAEKHRAMTVDANYDIRELLNRGEKPEAFTDNPTFMTKYHLRYLSKDILQPRQQIVIYNNTVAIYNWRDDQKVGVEIVSKAYAEMMRQVFEHYWQLAANSDS